MKEMLLIAMVLLGIQLDLIAQNSDEIFTIYLVRHAEKDMSASDYNDPPLSDCGIERAASLSQFLSDIPLEVIYSTDYTRTKSTALPTAEAKGLDIRDYNENELEEFAKFLIEAKQNALVVGHSNTTGVLAGLLSGEDIGAFDLAIYNRIYQIVIYKNKAQLYLFHSAFECTN
jgi:broad specificity phosphatase PhoE